MKGRALEETRRFVAGLLPRGARILEAGCGEGALTARLAADGFAIQGVDLQADAIATARARGVDATHADFLAFETKPAGPGRPWRGSGQSPDAMDAVLFTSSLHHISPLEDAIDHAHALLRPGGWLVVEDFAVEKMNLPTARWYYELGGEPGDVAKWIEEHRHEPPLHESGAMESAICRRFTKIAVGRGPYLYRYYESQAGDGDALFERECEAIAAGRILPIGFRVTARKR